VGKKEKKKRKGKASVWTLGAYVDKDQSKEGGGKKKSSGKKTSKSTKPGGIT